MRYTRDMLRPFLTMALSYLLVLTIPLVFACTLYLHSEKQIRTQQQSYARATLMQARDMADSMLSSTEEEILSLARNERVDDATAIRPPLSKKDYYALYLMLNKAIGNIKINQPAIIQGMYIHFFDIDRVFTFTASYSHSLFYQTTCGMTEEEQSAFTAMLEDHAYHLEYMTAITPYPERKPHQQLICVQSLPLYSNKPTAAIVMILNTTELEQLLVNVDSASDGCVAIVDANDNILSAIGNTKLTELLSYHVVQSGNGHSTLRHEGINYSISVIFSQETNWAYVSIVPESCVIDAVENLRHFAIILLIVAALISVVLIFLFTRQHQYPMIQLSRLVFPNAADGTGSWDVKRIIQQVERLMEHNRMLNDRIANVEIESRRQTQLWNNRKNTLRETLLLKLVTCPSDSVYSYMDQLSSLGVDFPFSLSLIVVSEGAPLPEWWIVQHTETVVVHVFTDLQDCYCAIINFSDEELACVQTSLSKALGSSNTNSSVFGVSALHEGHDGLGEAYREAILALNYCYMRSEKIVRFDAAGGESEQYLFPIEKEYKLIGFICAGNEKEALEEMDALVDINMNKRVLSLSMIRSLMFDISTTLTRAAQSLGDVGAFLPKEPECYHTFSDFYADVQQSIRRMCDYSQIKKRSKNMRLKDEIISDVKANYSDSQLSVAYLAEKHGITPSYLSHFFREQTGQTLLDFINRTRIDASLSMLLKDNLSIADISRSLGYADDSSFSRVFRKYMCTTPGAYRKENLHRVKEMQGTTKNQPPLKEQDELSIDTQLNKSV